MESKHAKQHSDSCHWHHQQIDGNDKHPWKWRIFITGHYLSWCIPRSMSPYGDTSLQWVNSLAPGRPRCHFKLQFSISFYWVVSKDNALRWMLRDLINDKSILVQVLAWCHQATSHYLCQCWPSSMLPYGITRPQWVKCHSAWSHW